MDKKQLQALTKKWYKKLADKGFKDLEDENGNLKEYASSRVAQKDPVACELAQAYYERARALLHLGYLTDATEKQVWRYYSEGMSALQISKKMGLTRWKVEGIVHDIERRYIKTGR